MSIRERILVIRLTEKLRRRPELARAFCIEVPGETAPPGAAQKKLPCNGNCGVRYYKQ